jgi:protein phosphatase
VDTVFAAIPTPVSPINEAWTDNMPNLDWESVNENSLPVWYRAWICEDTSFASPYTVYDSGWITDDNWQVPQQLSGDTGKVYYWRVMARDNAGNESDNSPTENFKLDITPPPTVTLSSPADDNTFDTSSVTLEWYAANDAHSGTWRYDVWVNGTIYQTTGITYDLWGLEDGMYSWKVRAIDEVGNAGEWSETRSFKIEVPKEDEILPDGMLPLPPTSFIESFALFWQASVPFKITAQASDEDGTVVSVTLYYRYRIDENWSGWKLFGTDNAAPWSWNFVAPEREAYYEFYSLAIDDDNEIEAVPTVADASCGVDAIPPERPTLLSPPDQYLTDNATPTFDWSDVSSLSRVTYELVIDDDADFSLPILQRVGLENSVYTLTDNEALTEGIYFWRVRAADDAGNKGEFSDARWLIVETEIPTVSTGFVSAGGTVEVDFAEYDISIVKVLITLTQSVSSAETQVMEIGKGEFMGGAEYMSLPRGENVRTYDFFWLVTTDIDSADISTTKIEFRILKVWIELENIDNSTIKLFRWKDKEWESLETKFLRADNTHLYFESSMEGFSLFTAIGGLAVPPPEEVGPTPPPTPLPPTPPVFPWLTVLALTVAIAVGSAVGVAVLRRKIRVVPPFIAYQSDVGRVRSLNEDFVAVSEFPDLGRALAVVADGMGGHAKGEVASRIAAEEITKVLTRVVREKTVEPQKCRAALREGFQKANLEILNYVASNPEAKGMGTTASAAVLDGDQLHVGHVGDTRVYVIDGGIRQVTKDHSLVQELVDKGLITPEEARVHPQRSVVTRAVGIEPKLKIDVRSETLPAGSYVLVCCDGLVNEVDDQTIANIVREFKNPQKACERLVDLANERGGRDNISVVILGPVKGSKGEVSESMTIVRRAPQKRR